MQTFLKDEKFTSKNEFKCENNIQGKNSVEAPDSIPRKALHQLYPWALWSCLWLRLANGKPQLEI